jgi:hypothetical protein
VKLLGTRGEARVVSSQDRIPAGCYMGFSKCLYMEQLTVSVCVCVCLCGLLNARIKFDLFELCEFENAGGAPAARKPEQSATWAHGKKHFSALSGAS